MTGFAETNAPQVKMVKKNVHLPDELIIEILLRLPVKTLLPCKCVCKSWFSIISIPDFATSHFQLAASPTNKLVCLRKYAETLSIDFNASLNHDSSYASLSFDFLPRQCRPKIRGSCRGFLFLHRGKYFYLWNPSTSVHKQIPASSHSPFPFLYGFAYNHSTDDYLVVLGSYDSSFGLEIFSLRANNWKQIEFGSHLPYMTAFETENRPRVGLLLNGAIHWMVYNRDTLKDVIIAFELKKTTMLEIAMPDDFRAKCTYPNNYDLVVHDGLINAWIEEMNIMTIWVMQSYAVHSSWTKIIEISVGHLMEYYSLSIVCFTNCGDIIGIDGRGRMVKFNDKGRLLERHSSLKGINSKRYQMTLYTESILSLPCGN